MFSETSVEDQEIGGVSIDLVTTRVLRGAQAPVGITVKNKAGGNLESLLFPLEISVDDGEFYTPGKASSTVELSSPGEPLILSTETTASTANELTITAR